MMNLFQVAVPVVRPIQSTYVYNKYQKESVRSLVPNEEKPMKLLVPHCLKIKTQKWHLVGATLTD
jgi:hypothetical protein